MTKMIQKTISIAVLVLAPLFSDSQSITWENSLTENKAFELIYDLVTLSNGDILAVGFNGFPYQRRLIKLDSSGILRWIKDITLDTAENSSLSKIRKVPKENNYYISGNSSEVGPYNYDFLIKIDTAGDTLWTSKFNYFTFYNTIRSFIVLKDKSVVTVGHKQTVNSFDVVYRRIDSLGNLMWEETWSRSGSQFGTSITEMMDGSLVIAGSNDDDILLMRIGFDGRLIAASFTPPANGRVGYEDVKVLRDNTIGLGISSIGNGGTDHGEYLQFDEALNPIYTQNMDKGVYQGPIILENGTYLFNTLSNQDSFQIQSRDTASLPSNNWTVNYGESNLFRTKIGLSSKVFGNDLYISGYYDSANAQQYWIAKIANVGEEWIPDPCAFSPPVAGFAYDLNGGLLTLLDTSYSGLPYLDTIYTWQWTFGNGLSDTTEMPLTLWDTASAPTLDVELIVSNWYGCIDTLQTTLVANPVGTGIIAQNQFEEKVWPNPARDILHISLSENTHQEQTFTLYDVHGRKQMQSSFLGKEGQLNISTLASGVYFYKLSAGGIVKRGKVVKN